MLVRRFASNSRSTVQTYMLQTVELPFGVSVELYVWSEITEEQLVRRLSARWGSVMKAMRPGPFGGGE
jgi:hypothetical protein